MISPRNTLSTASRVLKQLEHDRRTVALMIWLPALLLVLMRFLFDAQPQVFDRVGLLLLGIFPFTFMFLVTSVAMLRERTSGTLERLLTTPLSKLDLLVGYGLAFSVAAALQTSVAALIAFGLLGLDSEASPLLIGSVAVVNAILGMSLGLFASAFATSEFQAVQFMPLVVMPQVLLCGLLTPRASMAGWLQTISDFLPLTYAVQALTELGQRGGLSSIVWRDLGIVALSIAIALALGAMTLQRRTS